jgi:hypothetical protein
MFDFFVDIVFDGNLLIASLIAMIAGLISFASPCILPLVPGYLSYAAGMAEVRSRGRAALGSLLFVLGFSVLFISYGALFGSLGSTISSNSEVVSVILGLITIAMGVVFSLQSEVLSIIQTGLESSSWTCRRSNSWILIWNWLDALYWANSWGSSNTFIPGIKCTARRYFEFCLLLRPWNPIYSCWRIFR